MNGERPREGGAPGRRLEVDSNSSARVQRSVAPWGKVPRELVECALSKGAIRLFIAMTIHADGASRRCWASQATLAEELGHVSRTSERPDTRYVGRLRDELELAGLIRNDGRQNHGNRRWTRRWLVAPFPIDTDSSSGSYETDRASVSSLATIPTESVDETDRAYTIDTDSSSVRTDLLSNPSLSDPPSSVASRHDGERNREDNRTLAEIQAAGEF